jgi:hypothetical protein
MSSVPWIPMKLRRRINGSAKGRAEVIGFALACAALHTARAAETTQSKNGDVFVVDAQSATYLRLFQRAQLPGPAGAIVTDDRLVPIYEYFSLRVRGLDSPVGAPNSIAFELAGWGNYAFGDVNRERALDGDISVANVTHRIGSGYLRLGRQVYVGGASRFAQIDGLSVGLATTSGPGRVGLDVYAGSTVLPRWASRPGYHQLGSSADTLLRLPTVIAQPDRLGTWQAGTRVHGGYSRYVSAVLSYHEQRENTLLAARRVGFDAHLAPIAEASLSAQGTLDVDGTKLADARAWLDVSPIDHVSAAVEYLRTNPALFLSKQSVLSVFASDPFSEVGGDVTYRPSRVFLVGGSVYAERFDTSGFGSRVQSRVQFTIDTVTLQLALGRVADPRVGYTSSRASLRWAVARPMTLTLDQYYYAYDVRILGVSASSIEAATAEWRVSPATRLALSGSVTQSPYAVMDTQGLLRLIVDFGAVHNQRGGE